MKLSSKFFSPSRSAFVLGFATLAAGCVSGPEPAPRAASTSPSAQVASGLGKGLNPRSFLGQPVSRLDGQLGAPALSRKEGDTEFRRYDLNECRAYVLVGPNGRVTSLSTGPADIGAPALPFEQCTARGKPGA